MSSTTHARGHTLDFVITRSGEQLVNDFIIFDPGISDHLHWRRLLVKERLTKTLVSSRKYTLLIMMTLVATSVTLIC